MLTEDEKPAQNSPAGEAPPVRAPVDADHLRPMIDAAARQGIDTDEVWHRAGLVGTPASTRRLRISDYFRFKRVLGAAVQDETCHLSARQLLPGTAAFVLSNVPARASLIEVMESVARTYNMLHGGDYNAVRVDEEGARFRIDDRGFPFTIDAECDEVFFVMEMTMIHVRAMLRVTLPDLPRGPLRRIGTRRPPEAQDNADHLDHWPCPVRFGSDCYELVYDGKAASAVLDVARPEHRTDTAIEAEIARVAGERTVPTPPTAVVTRVRELIEDGVGEQLDVAERLGVSPATLRRHLADAGVSFREVRRDVLDRRARQLLETGTPVTRVAERLGFSDVRSFNRAFKLWNGVTPAGWRDRL